MHGERLARLGLQGADPFVLDANTGRVLTAPGYRDNRYNPFAISEALEVEPRLPVAKRV